VLWVVERDPIALVDQDLARPAGWKPANHPFQRHALSELLCSIIIL
jgi:hypothetical protein